MYACTTVTDVLTARILIHIELKRSSRARCLLLFSFTHVISATLETSKPEEETEKNNGNHAWEFRFVCETRHSYVLNFKTLSEIIMQIIVKRTRCRK